MPVFGLNNGTVPIIASSTTTAPESRTASWGTLKLAAMYAVTIMLIGLAVVQLIPDKLLMIFSASDTMLSIGIPALRTISLSFLFAGFSIVCSSMFPGAWSRHVELMDLRVPSAGRSSPGRICFCETPEDFTSYGSHSRSPKFSRSFSVQSASAMCIGRNPSVKRHARKSNRSGAAQSPMRETF